MIKGGINRRQAAKRAGSKRKPQLTPDNFQIEVTPGALVLSPAIISKGRVNLSKSPPTIKVKKLETNPAMRGLKPRHWIAKNHPPPFNRPTLEGAWENSKRVGPIVDELRPQVEAGSLVAFKKLMQLHLACWLLDWVKVAADKYNFLEQLKKQKLKRGRPAGLGAKGSSSKIKGRVNLSKSPPTIKVKTLETSPAMRGLKPRHWIAKNHPPPFNRPTLEGAWENSKRVGPIVDELRPQVEAGSLVAFKKLMQLHLACWLLDWVQAAVYKYNFLEQLKKQKLKRGRPAGLGAKGSSSKITGLYLVNLVLCFKRSENFKENKNMWITLAGTLGYTKKDSWRNVRDQFYKEQDAIRNDPQYGPLLMHYDQATSISLRDLDEQLAKTIYVTNNFTIETDKKGKRCSYMGHHQHERAEPIKCASRRYHKGTYDMIQPNELKLCPLKCYRLPTNQELIKLGTRELLYGPKLEKKQ